MPLEQRAKQRQRCVNELLPWSSLHWGRVSVTPRSTELSSKVKCSLGIIETFLQNSRGSLTSENVHLSLLCGSFFFLHSQEGKVLPSKCVLFPFSCCEIICHLKRGPSATSYFPVAGPTMCSFISCFPPPSTPPLSVLHFHFSS